MEIVNVGGSVGTYSWSTGFKPSVPDLSLLEEARKNPEAVINRLLLQGNEEVADKVFWWCVGQ